MCVNVCLLGFVCVQKRAKQVLLLYVPKDMNRLSLFVTVEMQQIHKAMPNLF